MIERFGAFDIHFEDHEHYMDFKVFRLEGVGEGLAETFWEGSIKWDGCSNWDFKSDSIMVHFCDRAEAVSIGLLMGRLYDIAASRLPGYDG